MKKIVFVLSFLVASVSLTAQVQAPQPSPFSKVEQKVGLTDVHIEYSRPGVKGRTIFGDLVPFGKTWRTGANATTKITFSDDVKFGGKEVKKGTYALYTVPNKNSWEVLLYADSKNMATPANWDDSKVVAKATAKVNPIPFNVETFTMDINNITNNGATLDLIWEKSYVAVPFEVPTKEKTMASIKKVMAGAGANDYFSAASFYHGEGMDLSQAKEWIDKAIELRGEEAFWMLREKSLIHASMGDKKGAIAAAKRSLASATAAKNAAYIKMNEESLKEWGAK